MNTVREVIELAGQLREAQTDPLAHVVNGRSLADEIGRRLDEQVATRAEELERLGYHTFLGLVRSMREIQRVAPMRRTQEERRSLRYLERAFDAWLQGWRKADRLLEDWLARARTHTHPHTHTHLYNGRIRRR